MAFCVFMSEASKIYNEIEDLKQLVDEGKMSPDTAYLLMDSMFWKWYFLEHLEKGGL